MPRIPRDAEHLFRLALLFAAGVVIFLVLRSLMVPAGFGELGHFRPGAIGANQQKPLNFAGRTACTECHSEIATELAAAKHGKIGCEACHGPLAAHATDPAQPNAAQPAKLDGLTLCSRCHAADPARPQGHPQVDVAEHSEGERCTECHEAHDPTM